MIGNYIFTQLRLFLPLGISGFIVELYGNKSICVRQNYALIPRA